MCSLENGRRFHLIVKCSIFTGMVPKTKQLINRVKNEKMFAQKEKRNMGVSFISV